MVTRKMLMRALLRHRYHSSEADDSSAGGWRWALILCWGWRGGSHCEEEPRSVSRVTQVPAIPNQFSPILTQVKPKHISTQTCTQMSRQPKCEQIHKPWWVHVSRYDSRGTSCLLSVIHGLNPSSCDKAGKNPKAFLIPFT